MKRNAKQYFAEEKEASELTVALYVLRYYYKAVSSSSVTNDLDEKDEVRTIAAGNIAYFVLNKILKVRLVTSQRVQVV